MKTKRPVVDGLETNFSALGKALGITRQGAVYRYKAAAKVYGAKNVRAEHLVTTVTDPQKILNRQIKAAQEERDRMQRYALLHGPTMAAHKYGKTVAEIQAIM